MSWYGSPGDRRSWCHCAIACREGPWSRRQRSGPSARRRLMTEPFDEPLGIVAGDELADDPLRLGERLEPMEIEALFLQRPHEAFRHAVALRLADVGWRDRDAQPLHLVDPGVGDVLRAPIAAQAEPARDVFAEAPTGLAYALPNRFERRPPIAELHHVPADEVVAVVINGPEEPAPAVLLGVEASGVSPPHLVGARRDDRARVGRIPIGRPEPARRQELLLAHKAQDALAAGGHAAVSQPRPYLPVAFAVERRLAQDAADRRDQVGVADRGLRPALTPHRRGPQGRGRRVDARARHTPHLADHPARIGPARTRTARRPHRRDLFHSSASPLFSMRCSASSSRIINSPIFARARVSSRSSGSARVLRPRVPVSRNTRFQLSSSWAGIWLSRETPSRGSPRSSRSTNSVFRCTLHRSGSSRPPLATDSSAGAVVGFRAFFPMSASLVTMMISQTGVQRNRVRFKRGYAHLKCERAARRPSARWKSS